MLKISNLVNLSIVVSLFLGCSTPSHNIPNEKEVDTTSEEKISSFVKLDEDWDKIFNSFGKMTNVFETKKITVQSTGAFSDYTRLSQENIVPLDLTLMVETPLVAINNNRISLVNQVVFRKDNLDFIAKESDFIFNGGLAEFDRNIKIDELKRDLGADFGKGSGLVKFDWSDTSKYSISRLAINISLINARTKEIVLSTKNYTYLVNTLDKNDKELYIFSPTIGLKEEKTIVSGKHRAISLLTNYSVLEILGKHLLLPYWKILEKEGKSFKEDEYIINKLKEKFNRLTNVEKNIIIQKLLYLHGENDIIFNGVFDSKILNSINKLKKHFNIKEYENNIEDIFIKLYVNVPINTLRSVNIFDNDSLFVQHLDTNLSKMFEIPLPSKEIVFQVNPISNPNGSYNLILKDFIKYISSKIKIFLKENNFNIIDNSNSNYITKLVVDNTNSNVLITLQGIRKGVPIMNLKQISINYDFDKVYNFSYYASRELSAIELKREGLKFYKNGYYGRAIESFNRAIEEGMVFDDEVNKKLAISYFKQGKRFYQEKNYHRSILSLEIALKTLPSSIRNKYLNELSMYLGFCYFHNRRYEDTIKYLVNLDKDSLNSLSKSEKNRIYEYLMKSYYWVKDYQKVLTTLNFTKKEGITSLTHIELANVYLNLRMYKDAKTELRNALKVDDNNLELYNKIIEVSEALKELKDARDYSLQVVKFLEEKKANSIKVDDKLIDEYKNRAEKYNSQIASRKSQQRVEDIILGKAKN